MGLVDEGSDGPAPKGWSDWPMSKDIRAPISCLIVAILIPLVVIIYDLWLSDYPRTYLGDPMGRVLVALFFVPALFMLYFLLSFLRGGYSASFNMIYRKVHTLSVGDALEEAMPNSARPLKRTTGEVTWFPPNTAVYERYQLNTVGGVRIIIGVMILLEEDRVVIEVFTSNHESRATRDIIEACVDAMKGMGLEEPPVDQKAEKHRLGEHRRLKPGEQGWSYLDNKGTRFSAELLIISFGLFLILVGFDAILITPPEMPPWEILIVCFWIGPGLLLMVIYFMFPRHGPWIEQKERIHTRKFDARAPYVTGSIEVGLDRVGIEYRLTQHTYMDVGGQRDVFSLDTQGEEWVRIEVWDYSWIPEELETCVSIITSWGYSDAEGLKGLVDRSVMRGY